jgi:hypothetical protein
MIGRYVVNMARSKAQIGLYAMIIMGIAILAVLYMVQVGWVKKAFEIRAEAKIFIEVNDAKLSSILRAKTGDSDVMDFMVCEVESPGTCGDGEGVIDIADKMDVALIIYDEDGREARRYGKRISGEVIKVTIPLHGGRSSEIGFRSDTASTLA